MSRPKLRMQRTNNVIGMVQVRKVKFFISFLAHKRHMIMRANRPDYNAFIRQDDHDRCQGFMPDEDREGIRVFRSAASARLVQTIQKRRTVKRT